LKKLVFILSVFLVSCYHDLEHEKYILNTTSDTVTVVIPDFDSVYTIFPNKQVLIYSFKILDTKQESDECAWLGNELLIKNQNDSICERSPFIEENWTFSMSGSEKNRVQECLFTVEEGDF
jgi:hypothetical protein